MTDKNNTRFLKTFFIDQVDHVDQNKIEPTKPLVEKVSASDGIPIVLEKKGNVIN